jgi:hypothetical protein
LIHKEAELGRQGAWLSTVTCSTALAGCSGAPSQNILGAYFPSWMLCALAGLILASASQRLFAVLGLDQLLPVRALVYLALAVAFSFATWLAWLS